MDGKTARGSRDGGTPPTHLLAAYAPQAAAVVGQRRVDATTNEHKAALRLLGVLPPLAGAVVTGDAMFTHRDVCDAIHDRGGEYLRFVKDNQDTRRADLGLLLAGPPTFSPDQQRRWDEDVGAATTREKGHGRVEVRTITTPTRVNGYADGPRVGQVFRVERERRARGVTAVEVVYGVASLTREEAGAARLLGRVRSHWGIENGRHHVRDVTFREDACRVRSGNAPQVLASLRNVAFHLLRNADCPTVASATRAVNARPDLAMLHAPASISA